MSFLPQEIIAKKRDSQALSAAEISWFVHGMVNGKIADAQIAAFAMAVYFNDMSLSERIALTTAMRDSGEVLDWSFLDGPTLDKHSTGGIGDNTSLILAPILAACGAYVPMISGRGLGHTGGTLDKLDAIAGYNTQPDLSTFRKVTQSVGCAIIGQTQNLAPADKKLYAIRDTTATVASIPLITASILSKKLAAGLDALVLDIKTGSGAFMPTLAEAENLGHALITVANGAGMRTGALITDMNQPLASAAGNWLEVKNAMDFLSGATQDPRLYTVTLALCAEVLVIANLCPTRQSALDTATQALSSGAAAEKFAAMVYALGGPINIYAYAKTKPHQCPIIRDVFLPTSGIVARIDTLAIGMAVVVLGGGRVNAADKLDYAVGFDRILPLGAKVDAQTPIARIHARDENTAQLASARLISAYKLGETTLQNTLIYQSLSPTGANI